jgi:hypothetical protein
MVLDEVEIHQLLVLFKKLSEGAGGFTPEEKDLMRRLRENRDAVLPELYAISGEAIGRNQRGREKLLLLIKAVERICGAGSITPN